MDSLSLELNEKLTHNVEGIDQLNIFNLLYKVSEGLLSFIRSIFVVPGILEIVMDVINRHTIFPIYSRR